MTEKPENAIINNNVFDLWLDELTPCLRERVTGKYIKTSYRQVNSASEIRKIEKQFKHGYALFKERYIKPRSFDWEIEWKRREPDSEFYKLTLIDGAEIQGMLHIKLHQGTIEGVLMESAPRNIGVQGTYKGVGGHLTAIGVKRSYENGNKGTMFFQAKTELIEHYKKELKATVYRGTMMEIDCSAARYLLNRYFGEEDD